jgi:hypothetical protein
MLPEVLKTKSRIRRDKLASLTEAQSRIGGAADQREKELAALKADARHFRKSVKNGSFFGDSRFFYQFSPLFDKTNGPFGTPWTPQSVPELFPGKDRMKPILLTLVIAAFLITTVPTNGDSSWQEPEDFRGLKWGASVEEMRKVFRTAAQYRDIGNRIKLFFDLQRIGDRLVELDLGFLDDRFSHASISFKSDDFVVMRDAFITRYGPAHSTTEQTLQNRAGAEFVNPILTWKGPTLTIRIQKYAGTLTDGSADLGKHEFTDELVRIYKQKGKDAAKDL